MIVMMILLSLAAFIRSISSQPIPDSALILGFLGSPSDFFCDVNDTAFCDPVGFACNMDTGLCFPPCEVDADCVDFGPGTGLNKCSLPEGACTTDGTCEISEDECATVLGFTCNSTSSVCQQAVGCTSNDECTSPGIGYCDTTLGTGICSIERCDSSSQGCVTEGYVCQSPPGVCIESCQTNNICASQTLPLECGDSGLCELYGCLGDADCTGFTNTCIEYNVTTGQEGICITMCNSTSDCMDLGIPGTTCQEGFCIPELPFIPTGCSDSTDCPSNNTCVVEVGFCLPNCGNEFECSQAGLSCDVELGYCYPGCIDDSDCDDFTGTVCKDAPLALGYKMCIIDNVIPVPDTCSGDSDCDSGYKCNSFVGQGVCYPSCNSNQDCRDLGLENPCKSETFNLVGITKRTIKYCDVTQTLTLTTGDPVGGDETSTTTLTTTRDPDDNDSGVSGVTAHTIVTVAWIMIIMFSK